jgi:hypothetical protein
MRHSGSDARLKRRRKIRHGKLDDGSARVLERGEKLGNAASTKLPSTEMCYRGQIGTLCGLQDW